MTVTYALCVNWPLGLIYFYVCRICLTFFLSWYIPTLFSCLNLHHKVYILYFCVYESCSASSDTKKVTKVDILKVRKSIWYSLQPLSRSTGCLSLQRGRVAVYGVRNLEMTIRFSLKSRPSKRFHRSEMSQIKAEISLRTNVKLIFHKNVGFQWYT